ncbi:MAG: ankyrin repeat domain-containing protein [Victivallaceae bacterium]|jgi:ankyrin repeat protein
MRKIHIAARDGNLTELQKQLMRGVNINVQDKNGLTPLHYACWSRCKETIKYLLSKGASPLIREYKNGYNPIEASLLFGDSETVKMFFRMSNINFKDTIPENNFTLLHMAAYKKCASLVKYFIDIGFDVNARLKEDSELGSTPLLWACQEGDLQIVKLLVRNGADVNIDDGHATPLYQAVTDFTNPEGRINLVKYLLKHGADINRKFTLHAACAWNRFEMVKLLLGNGADMEQIDDEGRTPIFYSAMRGHKKLTQYLISLGANTGLKDNDGNTIDTIREYYIKTDKELEELYKERRTKLS